MTDTPAAIMESVIAKGDLAKLTPAERTEYYMQTCRSMGLNPLTQPFSYIILNNKLTLYANRACADQLRKVNAVSLEVVSERVTDDILTVHVRAKMPDGRVDEDWGSVPFPPSLKGDFRANMKMKAVTKAKRRATLSICGLGWLDETEIDALPHVASREGGVDRNDDTEIEDIPASTKRVSQRNHDEIPDSAADVPEAGPPAPPATEATPPERGGAGASVLRIAEIKARQGKDVLMAYSESLVVADRKIIAANIEHLKALYPK